AAREQALQARQELDQANQRLEEARSQAHEAQAEFFAVRDEVEAAAQELADVRQQIVEARRAAHEARRSLEHVRGGAGEVPGVEPAAEPAAVAVARNESAQDRLARYLNDAWAVEKTLAKTYHRMAEEVIDPTLRELLAAHRATTERQQQGLEERLR